MHDKRAFGLPLQVILVLKTEEDPGKWLINEHSFSPLES